MVSPLASSTTLHNSDSTILLAPAGYIIPVPSMKPWFAWIRWLNPIYYALEACMANECTHRRFSLRILLMELINTLSSVVGQAFECIPTQLAPYGPGYAPGVNQGCAMAGVAPDSTTLDGATYLSVALRLYKGHM